MLNRPRQVISFEGLVRIWVHDRRFNGDVWFPFLCPLTKWATSPIRDVHAIEMLSRIGASLGLPSTPQFHFRYRDAPGGQWTVYPLLDQLLLASKLVLAFHRREKEPLLVGVRHTHMVSIRTAQDDNDTIQIALTVFTTTGAAERREIEFHVTEEAESPLPRCRVVSEDVGDVV